MKIKNIAQMTALMVVMLCTPFSALLAAEEKPEVSESPLITVYKDPNCGCCSKWVDHLEAHGLQVKAINHGSMDVLKAKHGIRTELASCHTAFVNGKIIEGHVPAASIKKLLSDNSDIKGLSVPGMPMMSPGMAPEHMEPRKELGFKVLAFDEAGKTSVYDTY